MKSRPAARPAARPKKAPRRNPRPPIGGPPDDPRTISFDPSCFVVDGVKTSYRVIARDGIVDGTRGTGRSAGLSEYSDKGAAEQRAARIGGHVETLTTPRTVRIAWRLADVPKPNPKPAAKRRNPETVFCPKCSGTKAGGYIPQYKHVEGGVCFLCQGKGVVTEKQASRWYAAQHRLDSPKGPMPTTSSAPSEIARKRLSQDKVENVLKALDPRSPIYDPYSPGVLIDIVKKQRSWQHEAPHFVMEIFSADPSAHTGGDVYFEGRPGAWKVFAISQGLSPYTTPAKMQAALNAIQRGPKANPKKRKTAVKVRAKAPVRRRNPASAIGLTAAELAEALYSGWDGSWRISGYQAGAPEAVLNLGHYEGTKIPVRRVIGSLPLRVIPSISSSGAIVRGLVEDGQGGWAAERFGPSLSATETRRVVRWVENKRR